MINASLAAQLMSSNTDRSITQMVNGTAALSGKKMDPATADKVANDFEAMFVSQMLSQMFEGDSIGDDSFGDSETSEIYKSLTLDAYGKKIADAGGIGVADYVKKTLLKLQEV